MSTQFLLSFLFSCWKCYINKGEVNLELSNEFYQEVYARFSRGFSGCCQWTVEDQKAAERVKATVLSQYEVSIDILTNSKPSVKSWTWWSQSLIPLKVLILYSSTFPPLIFPAQFPENDFSSTFYLIAWAFPTCVTALVLRFPFRTVFFAVYFTVETSFSRMGKCTSGASAMVLPGWKFFLVLQTERSWEGMVLSLWKFFLSTSERTNLFQPWWRG